VDNSAVSDFFQRYSFPRDALSRSLWARGGKRAVDFCIALFVLLLVSPVLLLAAIAIKLTSPGPLFFSQGRTGRNGEPFRIFKFRTMRADRKPDVKELVPLDHPDITPVGYVLRRLKIDELPQVAQVLTGEMALVGPRPTLGDQTDRYDEFEARRLLARPGISGLAQVNGSASLSWDERIKYDVYYVKHHGLLMDAGILMKTVLVIGLGEGRLARRFENSRYAARDNVAREALRIAPY
jgi:lipopolysaccharide/colanic/teichoic acid biosynthesis glycosyltransferase